MGERNDIGGLKRAVNNNLKTQVEQELNEGTEKKRTRSIVISGNASSKTNDPHMSDA
jgi:hypothetical protein